MKNTRNITMLIAALLFITVSCKKDGNIANAEVHDHDSGEVIPLDKNKIDPFLAEYPDFKEYESDIKELYKNHDYHYIWLDKRGPIEFAGVIHERAKAIESEGLPQTMPYREKIDAIFSGENKSEPNETNEFLISAMYFYFAKNVYHGVDAKESKETGWYLPREKESFVAYLDTLMKKPELLNEDRKEMYGQYYNLKKGLKKYREIEKNGGWGTITIDKGVKSLKPGDSSATVAQVRKRLFMEGYLSNDSGKSQFDSELTKALANYEKRHNRDADSLITPALVKELNIPVAERIKTITVNMERCRWVPGNLNTSKDFIAVNIPSFWLQYIRDGKEVLTSRVVVGKEMNKTVVFSGEMSYLAFSPYWNIPPSILENEIKPGIAKDPNYLSKHNMEWVDERVRQKPGGSNSLGLVKFMFPNSNNIYLHDTPAKSLFNREERAFSHGCVRVEKARDLAIAITKHDGNWTEKKVDEAMNAGKENTYSLKQKIPVYIAYFTAWADEDGNIAFFEDIYNRDDKLANLINPKK